MCLLMEQGEETISRQSSMAGGGGEGKGKMVLIREAEYQAAWQGTEGRRGTEGVAR